jgi:tetratricopeptide (TPR) repeat protein
MIFLKQKYILLFALLLFAQLGMCCMNEYKTHLNGEIESGEQGNTVPFGFFRNKDYLLKRLYESDSIYKFTRDFRDYSDYATLLVYNGQYLKAKLIFQEIENKSPGLYETAANLGTTYELLGKNDSAYYWIDKAIKINPNSHKGSEWIHLKILKAKIEAKGNQKYFLSHSILSLNFGNKENPKNVNKVELRNLHKQLFHQLNERITFIKPKDLIIGQLLFDLGNISAIAVDVESAIDCYELAEEYGFESLILNKRKTHLQSLTWKANLKNGIQVWIEKNEYLVSFIVLVIFLSFSYLLFLVIKKIIDFLLPNKQRT